MKHCQVEPCGIEIWVGPKQLAEYNEQGGCLVCVSCGVYLAKAYEQRGESVTVEVLDPNADDVPRRI